MSNISQKDRQLSLERMSYAMEKSVSVYTEINLSTMEYKQINFNNADYFSVDEIGDYEAAFEHMCNDEIAVEDVLEVRKILSPSTLMDIANNKPSIDEVHIQYKLRNSVPMKTMESRAIFLRNDNPVYVVVLAKDVTEFAKLQRQHKDDELGKNAIQDHLDTIMHMNPTAMSTFRINVTQNKCGNGSSRYHNFIVLQTDGTVDGYVKKALEYFPYEKERKIFEDTFNQEALITAFRNGQVKIEMKHHYFVTEDNMMMLLTSVNLTKNKYTGDIEGVVYTLDVTAQERNSKILQILFEREYEGSALINVSSGTYTLYKFEYEPDIVDESADMDYEAGAKRLADKFVWEDEKEAYLKKVNLDTIVSELNQNNSYSFTTIYKDKSGNKKYKKIFYYYIDEFQNEIFCVTEDITELTRTEQDRVEKLRQAVMNAERANEAKTLFMSSVSHDLRTPLNSVLGFAELAKETENIEEIREYLNKVTTSGDFLLSLINDTLSISKIETGKMTLEKEAISLNGLISDILDIINNNSKAKQLHIKLNRNDKKDYVVNVDTTRTKQIFTNILTNAIKFTPEGGKIFADVMYIEGNDGTLKTKTSIRDTGVGMSEEFLSHIFEPFAQEDAQKNGNYTGTGLGMSITKGIVELMGGRIEVKSELAKGSEFIVYLDFEIIKNQNMVSNYKVDDYSILKGKKILLCEDHPLNRELAKKLLEKEKIQVEMAENGKIGYEKFLNSEEGYYDAILMDVRMPEVDGLQATTMIRKLERKDAESIPIIAMTANAYEEDKEEVKAVGMTGHISKPINTKELFSTLVKRICEYRK